MGGLIIDRPKPVKNKLQEMGSTIGMRHDYGRLWSWYETSLAGLDRCKTADQLEAEINYINLGLKKIEDEECYRKLQKPAYKLGSWIVGTSKRHKRFFDSVILLIDKLEVKYNELSGNLTGSGKIGYVNGK